MKTETKLFLKWAQMMGTWQLDEKQAVFRGSPESRRGILLGPDRLGNGTVKTTVALSEHAEAGSIMLGYETSEPKYITAGLGGFGNAYAIAEFTPEHGWRKLAGAGSRSNMPSDRSYAVQATVDGQKLDLTIDGIKVLTHFLSQPLQSGNVGLSARTYEQVDGSVTYGPVEVCARPPRAFVVMLQFTSPFDELYQEVIWPVCTEAGIEAYRASDVHRPGIIMQDIVQGLAESDVIIAEITPANPNVFYELGYAHAMHKPVIMLAEQGRELPFDVSGYRVIFYEDAIRGKSVLETGLRRHLTNIFG